MTRVFYGGDPRNTADLAGGLADCVEIEVIRTILCSRVPIWDGPTRLYDELTLEVIGYLNPRATSYAAPLGEATPLRVKNERAAKTDDAIQAFLFNPRRKLAVAVGDDFLHESPPPTRFLDAANGPLPYRCDVLSITGTKTIMVRFGVRTWINPCERVTGKKTTPLLSHRWTREGDVDQDGYTTLITRGHAVFDTGKLTASGSVPDDFWDLMCHPLEIGFRRNVIQVTATEDNRELEYCVIDRETPLAMLEKYGVTRVQCTIRATLAKGSLSKIANRAIDEGNRLGDLGNKILPGLGGIIGGAIGLFKGTVEGEIPTLVYHINAKVWGHSLSKKVVLEKWGKVCVVRLLTRCGFGPGGFADAIAGWQNSILHDVNGKYVEVDSVFEVPPITRVLEAFEEGIGAKWPSMPTVEGVDNFLVDSVITNAPLPGGDYKRGGTRGTWLGKVAAQALTRSCQRQPPPKLATVIETEFDVRPDGIVKEIPIIVDRRGLDPIPGVP